MSLSNLCIIFCALTSTAGCAQSVSRSEETNRRVATVLISQSLINEQLIAHNKSKYVLEPRFELDSENSTLYLHGKVQVPSEKLRAFNLDPNIGLFRFQVSIRPSTTKSGYLILDFPLEETYFYPAASKDKSDRVIVPVQLLSLVLASLRGYFTVLSGDFSGFDQQIKKLEENARHTKGKEKKESIRLEIKSLEIDRKVLEKEAQHFSKILGLVGEKELNLNADLAARRNAIIFKINIPHLVPYLQGVELGGVRLTKEKFLAIDITSVALKGPATTATVTPGARDLLIARLNQSLFESESILAEEKKISSKIRDVKMEMQNDGLHVSGRIPKWFFSIGFDTIVDFVSTAPNVFQIRVREVDVEGINFTFLTQYVFDSLKQKLDLALKGICTFDYIGEEKDRSRALRVTVDHKKLAPAFPNLNLIGVEVAYHELLLKIGR